MQDITNKEENKIIAKAIKNKEKISYYLDQDQYILKIKSPTSLILKRSNSELDSIIYFEKNKVIPANFTIKENNLSLNIDIRTDKIEISDNHIKVLYTVIDSDNSYEYHIEMSE